MPESRALAEEEALFLLLELNDALFPIGHMHTRMGSRRMCSKLVHDAATAGKWLQAYFSGNFLYGELLSARLAYEAFPEPDGIERLQTLEEEVRARACRANRARLCRS